MRELVNKEIFYKIIDSSFTNEELSNYSMANSVENLLNEWQQNKEWIYKLFGEKLTIERPCKGTASVQEMEMEYAKLKNNLLNMDKRFSYVVFVMNTVIKDASAITISENILKADEVINNTLYKTGSKYSKAFATLVPPQLKDKFNTAYSMFLQNLKTEGVLVLSIDPTDYLSMSMNNNNWSSCHSINGDYQTGTVSYMTDKVSIVAYLKSINNCIIQTGSTTIEWNNKKWRQMVYLSEDMNVFVQSREYPNNSLTISNSIRDLMNEVLGFTEYETTNIEDAYSYLYIVDDIEDPTHYNDIVKNRGDFGVYTFKNRYNPNDQYHITVGNYIECFNDDCTFAAGTHNFLCCDCE